MIEHVFISGAVCDVSRPLVTHQVTPVMPSPKSLKNNYPELIKGIREAKNKAEIIAAMRRFIVWNDTPDDVWEKLEETSHTKR